MSAALRSDSLPTYKEGIPSEERDGYTTGVRSSCKLEAACVDVVAAFQWLAAGSAPDYRSIAPFPKRHLSALGHLLAQSRTATAPAHGPKADGPRSVEPSHGRAVVKTISFSLVGSHPTVSATGGALNSARRGELAVMTAACRIQRKPSAYGTRIAQCPRPAGLEPRRKRGSATATPAPARSDWRLPADWRRLNLLATALAALDSGVEDSYGHEIDSKGAAVLTDVHALLTGDLLRHLDAMGHSDSVVIADANFPAERLAARLLTFPGQTAPDVLAAVRTVLPLDDAPALDLMSTPDGGRLPVQEVLIAAAQAGDDGVRFLSRPVFYEMATAAYLIIRTGETRLYGNAILRKGVVAGAGVR